MSSLQDICKRYSIDYVGKSDDELKILILNNIELELKNVKKELSKYKDYFIEHIDPETELHEEYIERE